MNNVATKMFLRLAEEWGLNRNQQITLLGQPSERTFYRWRSGHIAHLPHDTVERISVLIGIRDATHVLLPIPERANAWVKRPNDSLGGRSGARRHVARSRGTPLPGSTASGIVEWLKDPTRPLSFDVVQRPWTRIVRAPGVQHRPLAEVFADPEDREAARQVMAIGTDTQASDSPLPREPDAVVRMAPFRSLGQPSRFSDGSFGVLLPRPSTRKTAIAETVFHAERHLHATNEDPIEVRHGELRRRGAETPGGLAG